MSTKHEDYTEENPEAYQGKVTDPRTPKAEKKMCSIAEAANYYNLPKIISRFGDWVICEDGLYCLYVNYHIAKIRFNEPDWVNHVTQKTWVNKGDFIDAFEAAKEMVANGTI